MDWHETIRVLPGKPFPLGAAWDGEGVNFAIFSAHATKVELCLFESPHSTVEFKRIILPERSQFVWHAYLPGIKPGQIYGYRIYGPFEPLQGHRFNPHKIMMDPYAKAVIRDVNWHDAMFGYRIGDPAKDLSLDTRDNAAYAPLAAVVDSSFDWEGDRPLQISRHKTLIYEMHVKGFTQLHPGIPESLRGKYLGLASEGAVRYLHELGISAVELMPIHQHVDDRYLIDRGLVNYWGYNTLSFFAPDFRYATTSSGLDAVREFKQMVKTLHAAGIEVILDVVYNHTCEGNQMGPMMSLKGVDNASYYRLSPAHPRYYEDFTGCGNTLNTQNSHALQLMMDSLRYWVNEMHVDGFRFDLASALARRTSESVDRLSSFFESIHQDPVLANTKLIAEPWDLSQGGYQVGNFPVRWMEWNAKYRDAVRRFWKGDNGVTAEFATRISGSSDLYEHSGRSPHASINFVTCHDGFSLQDLVSYNDKHNRANGENNTDGENHNSSWNCGAEGLTHDPQILMLRERQKRNFMATLLLSQGVPMIRAGDELGHTQRGNNNAYCQDNEISWINWNLTDAKKDFLDFTRKVIRLWHDEPVLRRRKFFQGKSLHDSEVKDISWFDLAGKDMTPETWHQPDLKGVAALLAGSVMDEVDERGEPIFGDTILILMNSYHKGTTFHFPKKLQGKTWEKIIDTSEGHKNLPVPFQSDHYRVKDRSLVVFRLKRKVFIVPMAQTADLPSNA